MVEEASGLGQPGLALSALENPEPGFTKGENTLFKYAKYLTLMLRTNLASDETPRFSGGQWLVGLSTPRSGRELGPAASMCDSAASVPLSVSSTPQSCLPLRNLVF